MENIRLKTEEILALEIVKNAQENELVNERQENIKLQECNILKCKEISALEETNTTQENELENVRQEKNAIEE